MRFYFLIIFLIILTGIIIFVCYGIFLPKEPGSTKVMVFSIQKGEGDEEISINLEKQGIIKNQYFFRGYVLGRGWFSKLQAGKYALSPAMNLPEIVNKFIKGDVIKIEITIPEGFTMAQIEQEINAKCETQNTNLELKSQNLSFYKKDYKFLEDAPDTAGLEGYLFPDTYQISYDISSQALVKMMLNNFEKKLTEELRKEIQSQKKTIFKIVTMASLIEKEVRELEDKKIVSGILWKRLKAGMPLQVDATITYITGKKTTNISVEETQIDSPYNTYKYYGLPLGPICNPGQDSILAAIYPKTTDYWFYLSTSEGETVFSKTLKEHNIAKAKYLK